MGLKADLIAAEARNAELEKRVAELEAKYEPKPAAVPTKLQNIQHERPASMVRGEIAGVVVESETAGEGEGVQEAPAALPPVRKRART